MVLTFAWEQNSVLRDQSSEHIYLFLQVCCFQPPRLVVKPVKIMN